MPVVIGVFVSRDGSRPRPTRRIDRFNRSYEYDGLGDDYVRFLLDELLPEVEKKKTADGRPIRLSKDGNDRCIAGSSSGAICAFTAAWERPDAFRRVFSAIGTYVGLRGGNVYPTLIRKYEPKPIRIFLQDGSSDLNIYGGDWWMANQEMERALDLRRLRGRITSGAPAGTAASTAPRSSPTPCAGSGRTGRRPSRPGPGRRRCRKSSIPGEDWTLVAEGYRFTEGPAANAKGEVFFNDIPNSKTYKIGLDGKVSLFLADSKTGQRPGVRPDGRLYAVARREQVLAYDAERQADGHRRGHPRQRPGRPPRRRHLRHQPEPAAPQPSKVWYIGPDGDKRVVDTGLKFANGVTLSPDQSLLYVADYRTHWVYSYQIQPDGSLANKQRYYHLHVPDTADDGGADGMRVDRDGRLYVATAMGIQVCDQAGRVNCIIPTPNGKVANLCFGGPEVQHDLRHLRRPRLQAEGQGQGRECLPGPDQAQSPRL